MKRSISSIAGSASTRSSASGRCAQSSRCMSSSCTSRGSARAAATRAGSPFAFRASRAGGPTRNRPTPTPSTRCAGCSSFVDDPRALSPGRLRWPGLDETPERAQIEVEVLGLEAEALRQLVDRLFQVHQREADGFGLLCGQRAGLHPPDGLLLEQAPEKL